jgi:hypothetical protein
MAALTAERDIPRKGAESTAVVPLITVPLKTGIKVWKGGIVCIDNTTGYGVTGTTATTLIAIGIATKTVDNTAGSSGALSVDVIRGLFPFNNSGGDLVVQTDFALKVYITDDNTVNHTSTGKSVAGVFFGFDENGLPLVQIGNLSATGV